MRFISSYKIPLRVILRKLQFYSFLQSPLILELSLIVLMVLLMKTSIQNLAFYIDEPAY